MAGTVNHYLINTTCLFDMSFLFVCSVGLIEQILEVELREIELTRSLTFPNIRQALNAKRRQHLPQQNSTRNNIDRQSIFIE
jgi:hypothetical protein